MVFNQKFSVTSFITVFYHLTIISLQKQTIKFGLQVICFKHHDLYVYFLFFARQIFVAVYFGLRNRQGFRRSK